MAVTKYRVKKGETFATLGNPRQLMALNPGVPRLSQGQTIFLPASASRGRGPGANPTPPSFGGSFFSPSGAINTGAVNIGPPKIASGFSNQPEFTGPNFTPFTPPANQPNMRGANMFQLKNNITSLPSQTLNQAVPPVTANAVPANEAGFAYNLNPKNTDPRNTAAYQQYAAEGTAFVNQMRWDPSSGSYRRIGDLIREGRLDVRDKNARLKARRVRGGGGGGGGGQVLAPVNQAVQQEQILQGNAVNANNSWRVG